MDSGCPSLLRVAYHQALLASVSLLMETRPLYALLDLMRQPSDAAIADPYPSSRRGMCMRQQGIPWTSLSSFQVQSFN